ncbi:histone deacetylase [Suhomyces tanzawaensis NRRL Y-17324]|uniref:Histone deacetylase n=1 Tax=Suhomyces tanzawaensis NRRL Y-17324 TaxID=984487 RepID=A0A1E4SE60_9ASCO|nr:histone deacetylase [Suhomyces tanzawaensis NRRL Y-17324]ODV77811.1 histone deacetylase [Suhomyces tanzawaensis NRRL Y-17324]
MSGPEPEVKRKVWITSDEFAKLVDLLPSNIGRQSLVMSLIKAFGLHLKCESTISIPMIHRSELESYHDSNFIDCLFRNRPNLDLQAEDEDKISDQDLCEQYGLLYDCYPFPFMREYVKIVASSTIASAKTLIRERSEKHQNVVINWYGGRHHCFKRKAAGFCYVNDIVLGILHLRKSFGKVFYLDLDLHHGDGVENAYQFSKNVLTCSIHRYDLGFYPGTGSLESSTLGKYNIPTKKGLSDKSLMQIVEEIVLPIVLKFKPDVVVIQSGCDGLGTDSHGEWNLTIKGFTSVVEKLMQALSPIPILVLGGGGYNHIETAKCWTYLTRNVLQVQEEWDLIPEHTMLDSYESSGFQFWTSENEAPKRMKDENTNGYLRGLRESLLAII